MSLVGLVILAVYTAIALAGLAVLRWLAANPPGLVPTVLALTVGVVVTAYLGYRAGTVRLVASLQAEELPRRRAPELHRRLDALVDSMDAGKPPLLVTDLGAPNALSLGGPRRGAVVLDRSLLQLLTVDELEGVLAHELAHVESHDALLNTLAITVVRTITGLVSLLLLPVVLFVAGLDRAAGWFAGRPGERPGLVELVQWALMLTVGAVLSLLTLGYLAYSRHREYAADRRAADITGRPAALARGLVKIHRAKEPRSGLFSLLYTHEEEDRHELLSTHPPLDRRVDRLLERSNRAPKQFERIPVR
ncbi:MAG: Zn-dependent protease [halophilic archaeon J07HX64]|jgi:Zn-dependent protease with chaperone function|nr:MAG: Zn-dependent protease [halophilic archaeon J07HX64]